MELRQKKMITDDSLGNFYSTWLKFDIQATQFVHVSKLSDLLDSLAAPLRVAKPNKIRIAIMDVDLVEGDFQDHFFVACGTCSNNFYQL